MMNNRLFSIVFLTGILGLAPGLRDAAAQAKRPHVDDYIEAALVKDGGFDEAERGKLMAALRKSFAGYATQIVKPEKPDAAKVALRMIVEGHFDGASYERMADVAFAAFQAVNRGAPADVAEGIGLYGYRKKLPADKISDWCNGYHHMVQRGVEPVVAADLVRNAMENDWEAPLFNAFKWALAESAKLKFDGKDYAAYLFGHYLKGGRNPGELTREARIYFGKLQKTGGKPDLPPYEGIFSRKPPPSILYDVLNKRINAQVDAPETAPEPAAVEPEPAAAPEAKEEVKTEAKTENEPDPMGELKKWLLAKLERWPVIEEKVKPYLEEPAKEQPEEGAGAAQVAGEETAEPAAEEPAAPAAEEKKAEPAAVVKTFKPKTQQQAKLEDVGLIMNMLWPNLEKSVKSYLGTPYVWGGTTRKGIDCSALMQNSYLDNRIGIPRVSKQQWMVGDPIPKAKLQEGDLVFFNTLGVGVSHVGMVVSAKPTKVIHASSSRGVVIDPLDTRYFAPRYLGARRVIN
ncbi:MAG: C40 family peptidase [Elusimicrobiota bacterium]